MNFIIDFINIHKAALYFCREPMQNRGFSFQHYPKQSAAIFPAPSIPNQALNSLYLRVSFGLLNSCPSPHLPSFSGSSATVTGLCRPPSNHQYRYANPPG